MTGRRGQSKLGCLVSLLLVAAVAYFGFNFGEPYLRFYRFQDALNQEARFARRASDDQIRARLRAVADSLGLPEEAGHVTVRRSASYITISSDYSETVELPLYVRTLKFAPSVSHGL